VNTSILVGSIALVLAGVLAAGQALWKTRHGQITSVRLQPAGAGVQLDQTVVRVAEEATRAIPPFVTTLATMVARGPGAPGKGVAPAAYRAQVEEAASEIDGLEMKAAVHSAELGAAAPEATVLGVQAAIPAGAALVESADGHGRLGQG